VLGKMQGNILQGHGRDHAVYLLLRFTAAAEQVRSVLTSYLPRVVTSALNQYLTARQREASGGTKDGGLFGSFFLSAEGYRHLGFSDEQIRALLPEQALAAGFRSNFVEGMKAHGDELQDPPAEEWEQGYQGEVHALLLLADDHHKEVKRAERAARDALASIAEVTATERGCTYRKDHYQAYEHFGFADGISQPTFFTYQRPKTPPEEWDGQERLSLLLIEDKAAGVDDAYGSFYVFRKLEQNVRGFADKCAELTKALRSSEDGVEDTAQTERPLPEDDVRVAAMAVGRFPDGGALVPNGVRGTAHVNDFVFSRSAPRCPLHAHIRKANPRGDLADRHGLTMDYAERHHRIARRSMTYGQRKTPPFERQPREDLPTGDVGILFGAYQASIANQFAFIQSWLTRTDFSRDGVGVDPITGARRPGSANTWRLSPAGPAVRSDFGSFVTLKGGEFFFAPSMPFLAMLAPP